MTNKDLIRMHLEQFIEEYPDHSWFTLLSYCLGYYGLIDNDILYVVRVLQLAGKIK